MIHELDDCTKAFKKAYHYNYRSVYFMKEKKERKLNPKNRFCINVSLVLGTIILLLFGVIYFII